MVADGERGVVEKGSRDYSPSDVTTSAHPRWALACLPVINGGMAKMNPRGGTAKVNPREGKSSNPHGLLRTNYVDFTTFQSNAKANIRDSIS